MIALVFATLHVSAGDVRQDTAPSTSLQSKLSQYPHRLVFETFREGNWEIMAMRADGTELVNLTKTPDADEIYPHASPDGKRLLFVGGTGEGDARADHLYCMDLATGERELIAEQGREGFWSPDGKRIGFAKGTHARFTQDAYDNEGLYFYDVETRKVTKHMRKDIVSILTPCWTPDGRWIVASAIRGCVGFRHSIAAIEAEGVKVVELRRSLTKPDDLYECRPDVSPDGKHVAWGRTNTSHKDRMWIEVCEIDFSRATPEPANCRYVNEVPYPTEMYHIEWSPCGRYIAFGQGPGRASRMQPEPAVLGNTAEGWDIWVVSLDNPGEAVQLTHDGLSNKEPDWLPACKTREP